MNQLMRALLALRYPGLIRGVSNQALVNNVANAVASKATLRLPGNKALTPVAALDQVHAFRALDALRGLAESTALRYPGGLAGLQRNWAVLRYLGMFAPDPEHRLSPLGARVVENHRRVLSEDLGIAFGLAVADLWCQDSMPGAVVNAFDIDVPLTRGHQQAVGQRFAVRQRRRRRPDYLLQVQDPQQPNTLHFRLLECKGTVSRRNVRTQLASAVGQLDGVTVDGTAPPALAVATYTGPGDWSYAAIDPGDDLVAVEVTDRVVGIMRNRSALGVEYRSERPIEVGDSDQFAAASLSSCMANLSAFGGNVSAEVRHATSADEGLRKLDSRAKRSTPVGDVIAVVDQFALGDQRFEIYQGIETAVDESLIAEDPRAFLAAQAALAPRVERPNASQRPEEAGPLEAADGEALRDGIWSLSPSGAVLGIVPL